MPRNSAFAAVPSRHRGIGPRQDVRPVGMDAPAIFYRDPVSCRTWDGTGPRPAWIAVAEDAGRSRSEFLAGGRLPGPGVRAWADGPASLQFPVKP